jgi:hypothetical protein
MKQEDADRPLIVQFTDLVHERRRAAPEDKARCKEQIDRFIDEHKENAVFMRRAKTLLTVEEALARTRKGGDFGRG